MNGAGFALEDNAENSRSRLRWATWLSSAEALTFWVPYACGWIRYECERGALRKIRRGRVVWEIDLKQIEG